MSDAAFTELDRLTDEEIKQLYHGIQELNRTPAGHKLIQRTAEKHRCGEFRKRELSFEVPVNFGDEQ
jgi:hypothetical protein